MQPDYNSFKTQFLELIKTKNKILVTSHVNPDDDSISSVLTMYWYLKNYVGKENIDIFYTGPFGKKWNYFEGFEAVKSTEDVANILENYDAVICLDGSQYHRFVKDAEKFANSEITKICIDHHSSAIDKFDLDLVHKDQSSCAEILYRLFYQDESTIDSRICEVIMLGILGDSGTFKFIKPTQATVFDAVKRLIVEGNIDIQLLKSKYEGFDQACYEVVKEYVKNSQIIKIPDVPDFIATFVDYEFIKEKNLSDDIISEARSFFGDHMTRSFVGVTWGMTIYPQGDNSIKVSMRSLPGSANVRILGEKLAAKYQGQGGGHDRAGGCSFLNVIPTDGVKKYVDIVTEFIKENGVEIS